MGAHSFAGQPHHKKKQLVKDGFEARKGFPNCCNAIDAAHINMEFADGELHAHWFDKSRNYSMILHAMVNNNLHFLDVMCGIPDVCNEIRVLRNSSLYRKAQTNVILDDPKIMVEQHIEFKNTS
ncbi:hypothetical protein GOP47_0026193 [Adiantum capillus-veneris]|nr:hypothetical protein GOP47_0026193 [Adiantum capillus-veneris]